jgi:hypothetical protein
MLTALPLTCSLLLTTPNAGVFGSAILHATLGQGTNTTGLAMLMGVPAFMLTIPFALAALDIHQAKQQQDSSAATQKALPRSQAGMPSTCPHEFRYI